MRLLVVLLLSVSIFGVARTSRAQVPPQPAVGTCLGGSCQAGVPVVAPQQDLTPVRSFPGFARGASWFGLFGGALSLAGAFGIAFVDDADSERITRGISFGFNLLAVPLVALGSYTTRKRTRVKGHAPSRALGWTAYSGAITNGGAMWYMALKHDSPSVGFTIGIGFVSLLAFLAHAFDAYVSARGARLKGFARVSPSPGGLAVRF